MNEKISNINEQITALLDFSGAYIFDYNRKGLDLHSALTGDAAKKQQMCLECYFFIESMEKEIETFKKIINKYS